MNDTPVLAKFYMGWAEDGVGPDGLPLYREELRCIRSRGSLLRLDDIATDEHIADYPAPYELFLKEQAARKVNPVDGYPLAMWPACSEAEFKMLADRDIVTVEQLAKLAVKSAKNEAMPAQIRELADRAKLLIEMQNAGAKYETVITDLKGQIEALQEQVTEAVKTIASQKAKIEALSIKGAA